MGNHHQQALECSPKLIRCGLHGCRDIYTPISNVVFHHYARPKGKSVFADHADSEWWATVSAEALPIIAQPPQDCVTMTLNVILSKCLVN